LGGQVERDGENSHGIVDSLCTLELYESEYMYTLGQHQLSATVVLAECDWLIGFHCGLSVGLEPTVCMILLSAETASNIT